MYVCMYVSKTRHFLRAPLRLQVRLLYDGDETIATSGPSALCTFAYDTTERRKIEEDEEADVVEEDKKKAEEEQQGRRGR